MGRRSTASIRIGFLAVVWLAAIWLATAWRDATVSITPVEAAAFQQWVRPPLRDMVPQAFDGRNHVMENLLIKRSVALFRLSEFTFRLPGLLGLGLYLWAVYRLSLRWGRAVLVLAVLPAGLGAGFYALAVLLMAEYQIDRPEKLNFSAMSLGLAAAANVQFLGPALGAVVVFVAVTGRKAGWWAVTERFVLTAVAMGFVWLAIPLSHGRGWPAFAVEVWPRETGARRLALRLRTEGPVAIGGSEEMTPVLEFYKAKYRLRGWGLKALTQPADYYVTEEAGLAVLVRPGQGGGFRPPGEHVPF